MNREIVAAATRWAKSKADEVLKYGQALTPEEIKLARQVGVIHPESVRLLYVGMIARPEEPMLAALCEEYDFLGESAIGLTLGYAVLIKQGHQSRRLLSHELRHVYQYECMGGFDAFLTEYISQIITVGYRDAPLEEDAREHEIL